MQTLYNFYENINKIVKLTKYDSTDESIKYPKFVYLQFFKIDKDNYIRLKESNSNMLFYPYREKEIVLQKDFLNYENLLNELKLPLSIVKDKNIYCKIENNKYIYFLLECEGGVVVITYQRISRVKTEKWHNFEEGEAAKPIKNYYKKQKMKRIDRKKFLKNIDKMYFNINNYASICYN